MPTSDFVSEAYLYIFGNLVAPAVASLAIDRRTVTLFIQLPTPFLKVPHARALADGLARRGARGAVGYDGSECLIASWIIGFIVYFSADAQNRESARNLTGEPRLGGSDETHRGHVSRLGQLTALLQMLLGKLEREPEQVSAIGGHRLRAGCTRRYSCSRRFGRRCGEPESSRDGPRAAARARVVPRARAA